MGRPPKVGSQTKATQEPHTQSRSMVNGAKLLPTGHWQLATGQPPPLIVRRHTRTGGAPFMSHTRSLVALRCQSEVAKAKWPPKTVLGCCCTQTQTGWQLVAPRSNAPPNWPPPLSTGFYLAQLSGTPKHNYLPPLFISILILPILSSSLFFFFFLFLFSLPIRRLPFIHDNKRFQVVSSAAIKCKLYLCSSAPNSLILILDCQLSSSQLAGHLCPFCSLLFRLFL